MKFGIQSLDIRLWLTVLAVGFVLLGGRGRVVAAPTESDGQVAARETALELAGAFTNDGYKIRDGHWVGDLKPDTLQTLTVNLYAGNQYYFSLGATDKAKKVSVVVYDEAGRQVEEEQFFNDKHRAAAGVSPVASGPYYVAIKIVEGDATDFCLLYSYK